MAEVKKLGSTKRFGARYGRKPKKKLAKIEEVLRKKQKCPYCSKFHVKRVAVGIWQCRKCKAKFTGKAYSIKKKIVTEDPVEDQKVEEQKAEKEGA